MRDAIAFLIRRVAAAALMTMPLWGCGGEVQGYPNFETRLLLPAPNAAAPSDQLPPMQNPDDCSTEKSPGLTNNRATRNNCIYALKNLIDNQYALYRISMHQLVARGNGIADFISLGLSTAGTAAAGAAIKTLLAAIDTGVKGTKTIANDAAFYKQSVENLINQMDADRNQDFAIMLTEMKSDAAEYPINEAKNDLLKYFYAGTWDHAITSLQTATASNSQACQTVVAQAKVAPREKPPLVSPPAKNLSSPNRVKAKPADAETTQAAPAPTNAKATTPTNCGSQVQAAAASE